MGLAGALRVQRPSATGLRAVAADWAGPDRAGLVGGLVEGSGSWVAWPKGRARGWLGRGQGSWVWLGRGIGLWLGSGLGCGSPAGLRGEVGVRIADLTRPGRPATVVVTGGLPGSALLDGNPPVGDVPGPKTDCRMDRSKRRTRQLSRGGLAARATTCTPTAVPDHPRTQATTRCDGFGEPDLFTPVPIQTLGLFLGPRTLGFQILDLSGRGHPRPRHPPSGKCRDRTSCPGNTPHRGSGRPEQSHAVQP
jgi:hypothetical protein